MKPLFDLSEIHFSSIQKLPFECEHCHKTFFKEKKRIKNILKTGEDKCRFCCMKCCNLSRVKKVIFKCAQCTKESSITLNQHKKSKSGKNFCSKSCATTYNNVHKQTGTRRSKLEMWLEDRLKIKYPQFKMLFNDKAMINSELDIYIPELKLAFELNGIYHYEPIHGPEKLASIQNNDERKFQACLEQGIELVIIDSSSMTNFKPLKAQKYFDIIEKIINIKIYSFSFNKE